MPPRGSAPLGRVGSSDDERALQVGAPLSGTVVALADVPDPVFAQAFVGPGLAIEPAVDASGIVTVVAPADGTLGSLFPHAFALETSGGRTVLVHLGIDTVRLAGEGFRLHLETGARVRAGQPLLSWELARVAALGLATVCPVVALQGEPAEVRMLVEPGDVVGAGDPVLAWGDARA